MDGSFSPTLYQRAVERKTAFVPGKFFYANAGEGNQTMRLNFTMADGATIEKAIRTLSEVILDMLK